MWRLYAARPRCNMRNPGPARSDLGHPPRLAGDGRFLPITTDRLVLRPMAPIDAAAFARYRSDPDVARYQSWDAPYPVASAERLIADQATLDGPVPAAGSRSPSTLDGELVGDVAVGLDAGGRRRHASATR